MRSPGELWLVVVDDASKEKLDAFENCSPTGTEGTAIGSWTRGRAWIVRAREPLTVADVRREMPDDATIVIARVSGHRAGHFGAGERLRAFLSLPQRRT